MIRSDYHMHSEFSSDSDAPMESMIQSAIKKRLTRICFTDHMDFDYPMINVDSKDPTKFLDFVFDASAYTKKLESLKLKYDGQIEILTGIELGLQEHIVPEVESLMNQYKFDFVIGSSHLLYGNDPYLSSFWEDLRRDKFEETTINPEVEERMVKYAIHDYFHDMLGFIDRFPWFQVYGHLDYIVRYAPQKDLYYHVKDYMDVIDEVLKRLILSGRGIEVNSAALRKGMKQQNPHRQILERYHDLGGEIITVGSDAHTPADIASRFDYINEILLSCGYQYYTTFKNKKPEFHKL